MDLAERLLYLRSLPAGPLLPADHLWTLASRTTEHAYRVGAMVFAEGSPVNRLVFMRQGSVTLEHNGAPIGQINAPGAVGVRALMANVEMPYAVRVRDELITMEIDADIYTELIEDHFDIWLILTRFTFAGLLQRQQQDPRLLRLSAPPSMATVPRSSALVERILYLRRRGLFGSSSVNALAEVAQRMEEKYMAPDEVLYAPGDEATTFHVLLEGQLTFATPDGFSCSLDSGSILGITETVAQQPRWGTVTAARPTRLLSLHIEPFLDVLEDNTEMAMTFLRRAAHVALDLDLAQRHQELQDDPSIAQRNLGAPVSGR